MASLQANLRRGHPPAPVPAEHHRPKRSNDPWPRSSSLWCCRPGEPALADLAIPPKTFPRVCGFRRGFMQAPQHRCRQPILHSPRRWAGGWPQALLQPQQPIPAPEPSGMRFHAAPSPSAAMESHGPRPAAALPCFELHRPFATTRPAATNWWARSSSEVLPFLAIGSLLGARIWQELLQLTSSHGADGGL